MEAPLALISGHPAGEGETPAPYPSGSWPVDTPGGRFHAEWDDEAPVTREGQLLFFFQFLHAGGRWEEFLRACPLRYVGNRGSGARNVMGTALLSILCGHWRYAHINAVRGDGVNPGLLGMDGTVSEDAVRLGIGRIEEKPALGLPCLFKLRHTAKVKDLVMRMMRQGAAWEDCGEGWDACATPWSGKIAVLVTSLDQRTFPAAAMPRHYRDRADAESERSGDSQPKAARRASAARQNCFDELKNQWGWNGYTSRRLASSRIMANLVALFYNWWNLYLRFYDEEHHREAIRSRPMLMSGVGRQVKSGGCRTVKVSVLHEKGDLIAQAVTRTSNELHRIGSITERWTAEQRWTLLLTRLLRRWLGGKWLPGLPENARLLLSG